MKSNKKLIIIGSVLILGICLGLTLILTLSNKIQAQMAEQVQERYPVLPLQISEQEQEQPWSQESVVPLYPVEAFFVFPDTINLRS